MKNIKNVIALLVLAAIAWPAAAVEDGQVMTLAERWRR